MKSLKAKCIKCGDIVEVSHPCEFKSCKCGAIALDYGDGHYSRTCGAPENFDKEFDKEQGIDRFKPFKSEDFETSNTNCDFYNLNASELISAICSWGKDHGIDNPDKQTIKLMEEVGELANEISRSRYDTPEVRDAIGDIGVVLIILSDILGYDFVDQCLLPAYRIIEKRNGKTVNGSFIKEGDD